MPVTSTQARESDSGTPVQGNALVRTILGDISSTELGVCLSHEHVIIDGGVPKIINPEIALQSVEAAVTELEECKKAGVQSLIDAMPADAGRNIAKLAEVARRTGIHIVSCTGLHHKRYYGERHWGELLAAEELAELFVQDITEGIDYFDLCGPVVRRSPHRAGCIKVAGSKNGLTHRDRRIFLAASIAAARTGAPIMTHCEAGTGGLEHIDTFRDLGVPLHRVILSHTDKMPDPAYHAEMLSAGVNLVYDQGLRTPDQTLSLLQRMVESGYYSQILLGTDAARRSLWTALGGTPGIAEIRRSFKIALEMNVGSEIAHALWVTNPARVFSLEGIR